MQSAKSQVLELLERLPAESSLDDILYHLYVMQAVETGRADARAGKLIPQDDLAAELRRRWKTDAA
jgi:hypothetical protein